MNKLLGLTVAVLVLPLFSHCLLAQTQEAALNEDPAAAVAPIKTEITATEGATADLQNRTATFSGDVQVIDPRFQMKTRSLSVVFSKDPAGLERATASGGVVIIQVQEDKPGAKKQDPAIGRAQRAVYDAKTGDIELSGSPEITQGANRHVATSAGTTMILNRSGQLRTIGSSKTEIIDRKNSAFPGQTKPQ